MSFLRPEFLFALPLVALPILIHLMNRRRFQVVEFSAMDFLRRALKRTRRRLLLEDILLLLLRTLAVLLLILALARPGVDPDSILGARPARGEILVLDASLSMSQREGGSSAFERAVRLGMDRLSGLDAARGDMAAVIVAGTRAERLAYGDPTEVRTALSERFTAGQGAAALAAALGQARDAAASLLAEGPRQARVTVLTDLQSTAWNLGGAEGEALRALAAEGLDLALLDTGGRRRANTAVVELAVDPPELSPGDFGEVRARIRNFGPEAREGVRGTLFLDGVPLARKDFSLRPGEEVVWTHSLAPEEPGARAVEVRLEGDSLPGDDRRAFILRVRPAPRVLLAGETAPTGQSEGVFETVRRFLDLGQNAPLQLELRALGRLDPETLGRTDVLLLADPGPVSPSVIQEIEDFHAGGGGVLLALGPRTTAAPGLVAALGGPGMDISAATPRLDPSARLRITQPDHPALAFFADPRWQPLLTEVPFRRFREIRLDAGALAAGGFTVPLRFGIPTGEEGQVDQGAALVEWKHQGGRCGVLAAAPDPRWNGMEAVPGGTLPFLLDLIAYYAPRPRHSLAVAVGDPLEVELPRPPTEVSLSDPGGRTWYPAAPARLLPGNRALQPLIDRAEEAGAWTVSARMLDPDGAEILHRERIAVLSPAAESDPAPLDPAELATLLPPGTELSVARSSGEGEAEAAGAKPRDLSHLGYLAVVGLLVLETLLAAMLDRRRG